MNGSPPEPHPNSMEDTSPMLIRWRGRQEGPYSVAAIEQKLAANEIGLLHEVCHNSKWITLRDYLSERTAVREAQRLATEEQERLTREIEERNARQREENQRAMSLAEEKRRNDLLEQNLAHQNVQGSAHGAPSLARQPHRGGMILAFGLLGLLVCFPFGIAAWSMGSADLAQMDAGLMDPSGRSTTSSGRTIGMIATLLWVAGIMFVIAGAML